MNADQLFIDKHFWTLMDLFANNAVKHYVVPAPTLQAFEVTSVGTVLDVPVDLTGIFLPV